MTAQSPVEAPEQRPPAKLYTWHTPERPGSVWGMLIEAEKTGIGTFAEGYLVTHNAITLQEAQERYGVENVTVCGPVPIVVDAPTQKATNGR